MNIKSVFPYSLHSTNRTKLELKFGSAAGQIAVGAYQSHQAGIEISLEWLLDIASKDYQSHQAGIEIRQNQDELNCLKDYQSHQAGIEIYNMYNHRSAPDKSTNRTKLELKYVKARKVVYYPGYQSHQAGIEIYVCY